MADIRKRSGAKGTTYQVRYPSEGVPSGYAYATFATMKEARAFSENLTFHKSQKTAGLSVPDAVDRWLNVCERLGRNGREKVEPQTHREYVRRARVIKEYDWPKPVDSLLAADIVHFRNWLLANKTRDLARRTLSSLHSVLIEMRHQGELAHDPASGVTVRSGGRYEDDEQIDIPSDQEIRALLKASDEFALRNDTGRKVWARYRPMIYLAIFTGMRPSEYRGLPWACIEDGTIHVVQRADKNGLIGPVKSRAGRRRIFVPASVTDMIFDWQRTCPASALDLVFPTDSGRPILLENFRRDAWQPLLQKAAEFLPNGHRGLSYNLYSLRHYFASKLIERGEDLKFIQQTMGHSKIEITFDVYGHLLKGREQEHRGVAEDLARELLSVD